MTDPRPLHRLFGLSWMDFFQGTDITVEMEMDLSVKSQFIDIVIIRKGPGPIPRPLPDGFEDLAAHNLLTFKSHQESLDDWTLCELLGHYVNYRKQSSPSMQQLLPTTDYRLFAVCARFPHNLAQELPMTQVRPGVYEVRLVTKPARIIVVGQLPQAEQNAMLHLFSARQELLLYGREHYRPYAPDTSSLLYDLFTLYDEDPNMPDKLKEFVRETREKMLKSLTMEQRLEGVTPEDLLKRFPPEDLLKRLSADDVIKALPPDVLEELKRRFKADVSPPKRSDRPRIAQQRSSPEFARRNFAAPSLRLRGDSCPRRFPTSRRPFRPRLRLRRKRRHWPHQVPRPRLRRECRRSPDTRFWGNWAAAAWASSTRPGRSS